MALARAGTAVVTRTQGSTTIDVAFTGVASGDLLAIGYIADGSAGDPTTDWTPSKSSGTATLGTITRHAYDQNSGASSSAVYTVEVTATGDGNATIRMTFSASCYAVAVGQRYTGADTSGTRVEDSDVASTHPQTSSPTMNSMTSAGAALFFASLQTYESVENVHSAGTNYNRLGGEDNGAAYMTGCVIDRIVTGGTSSAPVWSMGNQINADSWSACGVVIKEAASGTNGDVTGVTATGGAAGVAPTVSDGSAPPVGSIYSAVAL